MCWVSEKYVRLNMSAFKLIYKPAGIIKSLQCFTEVFFCGNCCGQKNACCCFEYKSSDDAHCSLTWGSTGGAQGWITSCVDTFLVGTRPGGLGITLEYGPWFSVSGYTDACLASCSFFPTTKRGRGKSLTAKPNTDAYLVTKKKLKAC